MSQVRWSMRQSHHKHEFCINYYFAFFSLFFYFLCSRIQCVSIGHRLLWFTLCENRRMAMPVARATFIIMEYFHDCDAECCQFHLCVWARVCPLPYSRRLCVFRLYRFTFLSLRISQFISVVPERTARTTKTSYKMENVLENQRGRL